MISAPDVVAFSREEERVEEPRREPTLPEEYSVPLLPPGGGAGPWARLPGAKFSRDFILVAEFSEQVGPQPLLTVPDDAEACGTFDLNYFSLRIMSVDYQASFVGPPAGGAYPRLHFVEDSQVVLGDSKEGAFAYVHHLTLYDLEARGFVRPFCMAYVSADERKIMRQFQELSAEFCRASERLKKGNRAAFAAELEKKLHDLDYTRAVLHAETERQKRAGDRWLYTSQAIDKANELASVEKAIIEHRDLLRQIRSYPGRRRRPEAPEAAAHPEEPAERSAYTPKLIKAKSAKCFDKKLKTLEELCDPESFRQTLAQLNRIEGMFRGDLCYLLTSQVNRALLRQQRLTNFLFEEPGPLEDKAGERPDSGPLERCRTPEERCRPPDPPEDCPIPQVLVSAGPFRSSVESVLIKMEPEVGAVPESSPCEPPESLDYLDMDMKGSLSSGESIEVLGTEKSSSVLSQSDSQASLTIPLSPQVVRSKAVSRRTVSEDSIEVLSTCPSEALIPEDFKASYPSAINEEPYADEDEGGIHFSAGDSPQDLGETGGRPESTLAPADSTCCIGKESPGLLVPNSDPTYKHCDEDGVVSIPPQRYKERQQGFLVDEGSAASQEHTPEGLSPYELRGSRDLSKISFNECGESPGTASTSSDRTPSPAHYPGLFSERHKKKAGQNALKFIRQYPFAHPAIYSLLSGRTLIVLGEEEAVVKKLVTALSIFVPNCGKHARPVKHWLASPLHIMDFQKWKLIGLQRVVSPAGVNTLHSLNRYSRYTSILDLDNKTLRCPLYRGTLVPRLADHRTQIKRGSTYYMHVQSVLTQLCSKAFLYAFCHHLHLPINEKETEQSVVGRQMNFLKLHLGLVNEDVKVVQYLAELLKLQYIQEPNGPPHSLLRFDYVPSFLYKI